MELKRLIKERDSGELPDGWDVEPKSDDDLYLWGAIIPGARDTPYEYGLFEAEIKIGPNYPMKPPRCKFITPCYHPNVGSDGHICVDILGSAWTPANTIKTLLISLQLLMECPEPDDPMNGEIASLYKRDREAFNEACKKHIEEKGMINPFYVDPNKEEQEEQEEQEGEEKNDDEKETLVMDVKADNSPETVEKAESFNPENEVLETNNSAEDLVKSESNQSSKPVSLTSLRDSVRYSVRDSVRTSVRYSVRDSVRSSVRYSLRDSVRTSVRTSLRNSVRRQSTVLEMLDQHSSEIEKMDEIHNEMVRQSVTISEDKQEQKEEEKED